MMPTMNTAQVNPATLPFALGEHALTGIRPRAVEVA
jgi:hypothetical protein